MFPLQRPVSFALEDVRERMSQDVFLCVTVILLGYNVVGTFRAQLPQVTLQCG